MNAPRLSTLNSIGSCIENDSILGFRVKPNQHDTQVTESIGEDTIFSVVFSTDSVSRRIPDDTFLRQDSIHAHSPGRHALFLGCSFTFGHGLMYSSTFPCLYEQLNPGYKSYNYGVPGFGPHQVALLFDQRTGIINDSSLREKGGFALYTYIDDHMNRVYGGSDYLYWWSHATRLIFVEHDSLVIHECSQFQLLVAKLITENGLCRHFGITLQYPHTQTFYKRFADIINYSARKYWELNPDNHFYIGIYPGYGIDLNWTRYLDEKIILLKVEAPADYKDNQEKYYLNKEYDRHPTGIFNVYYTNEITRLIKQYE